MFLIVMDSEKCAFMMRFCDYPSETLGMEEIWDDVEILGSIHDNPELMEEYANER